MSKDLKDTVMQRCDESVDFFDRKMVVMTLSFELFQIDTVCFYSFTVYVFTKSAEFKLSFDIGIQQLLRVLIFSNFLLVYIIYTIDKKYSIKVDKQNKSCKGETQK